MFILRPIVGVLVVTATVGATVWWQTPPASAPRPPAVEYPRKLDLGPQKFKDVVAGTLRVSNPGGSTLELRRFRTNCSCAGVEVFDDGRWRGVNSVRLPSGKSVELRVRVSVGAQPGMSQTVYARFDTNDPDHGSAQVEVAIPRVTADAYTDPAAILFGELKVGEPARRTVAVYDCGIAGRRMTRVGVKHPGRFEARLLPPGTPLPRIDHPYAGQAIGQVELIARTDQPGTLNSELEIEWEDSKPMVRRIPITGEVVGPVEVQPSAVSLPVVVSGRKKYAATLRLSSRDGTPIKPAIESVPDGLTVSLAETGGASAVLEVACREEAAGTTAAPRRAVVRLRIQTPTSSTPVDVPIWFP